MPLRFLLIFPLQFDERATSVAIVASTVGCRAAGRGISRQRQRERLAASRQSALAVPFGLSSIRPSHLLLIQLSPTQSRREHGIFRGWSDRILPSRATTTRS